MDEVIKIETRFHYDKPYLWGVMTLLLVGFLICLSLAIAMRNYSNGLSWILLIPAILLLTAFIFGFYELARPGPILTIDEIGISSPRIGLDTIPWYQIEDIHFYMGQVDQMLIFVAESNRWLKPDNHIQTLLNKINIYQKLGCISFTITGLKADLPTLVHSIENMNPTNTQYSY